MDRFAQPVVIDLGVMEHAAAVDVDEPATKGRPSPWLVVLSLMALCVGVVTAAGQPPPQPRLVFSAADVISTPRFVADGLVAYLDGREGPEVTGFRLVDGSVRWTHQPGRRTQLMPAGPVLLLAPGSCQSSDSFVTEALDPATGESRWTQQGTPVWLVADSRVAVFKQPVQGCAEATVGFDPLPSVPFQWTGVDLDSGKVWWSLQVPATTTLIVGLDVAGQARWLAVTEGDLLTAYDLRTGSAVGTLSMDSLQASALAGSLPVSVRLVGVGDQLLVIERSRGNQQVRAFSAPGLVPAWTSTAPSPRGPNRDIQGITARGCGPTLCLGSVAETVGIDPLNGAERWRVAGRPLRIGPRYALFVRSVSGPSLPVLSVIDLFDGRLRIGLADTDLLGRSDNAVLLRTRSPAGSGDADRNNGRLWRLDLGNAQLPALTALPRPYAECESAGRYLACRGVDGALNVWRLPARCPPVCGTVPLAGGGGRGWPRR